ncbi:MAG: MFS transporter [Chloroflexota bacterium]|nr:MFS transporter [Chloroflexota bacterium]
MDNPGIDSTTADSVTASHTLSFSENAQLRRLIVALFLTPAATYAIYFASMAVVEQETHSSAQMGFMILFSTLPGFLFAMLAGVVVDRQNRVLVLVISNVLRVLVVIGFAAATRWVNSLPLLLTAVYASNFLLSALLQFTASAEGALIPNVVASKQLLGANSIFQIVKLGGQGAGAALLAPALLQLGGAPAVGIAAVPLLMLSTWASARLRDELGSNEKELSRKRISLWKDLQVSWRFIARHASVRWAIGCLAFISAFQFVILTLAPSLAARVWGIPIEYMTYLAVPGGLAFGLGVWLLGRHGHKVREEKWIVRGFLALGGGAGSAVSSAHGARPALLSVSADLRCGGRRLRDGCDPGPGSGARAIAGRDAGARDLHSVVPEQHRFHLASATDRGLGGHRGFSAGSGIPGPDCPGGWGARPAARTHRKRGGAQTIAWFHSR